jgi:hypothetical protein
VGGAADPLRDVHGDASYVGAALFDLPGVNSGTDGDPDLAHRIMDRQRAPDSPARPVEGCQHAVAGGFDLSSAKPGDLTAGHGVVLIEPVSPCTVPEALSFVGRLHDVGEHDGGEAAVGRDGLACARQELFDFADEVGVARPR